MLDKEKTTERIFNIFRLKNWEITRSILHILKKGTPFDPQDKSITFYGKQDNQGRYALIDKDRNIYPFDTKVAEIISEDRKEQGIEPEISVIDLVTRQHIDATKNGNFIVEQILKMDLTILPDTNNPNNVRVTYKGIEFPVPKFNFGEIVCCLFIHRATETDY